MTSFFKHAHGGGEAAEHLAAHVLRPCAVTMEWRSAPDGRLACRWRATPEPSL